MVDRSSDLVDAEFYFIFMCFCQLEHFKFSFIYFPHDHAWNLPMQLLLSSAYDHVARSINYQLYMLYTFVAYRSG